MGRHVRRLQREQQSQQRQRGGANGLRGQRRLPFDPLAPGRSRLACPRWPRTAGWTRRITEAWFSSGARSGISDVRDGTTNTFLLGEKYLTPDHYSTGNVGADNESFYAGYNNDHYRLTYYAPLRDRQGYDHCDIFGSPHSAGCHFAFCDGSVHPIGYEIDVTVFQQLGDRRDGQTFDKSEF